MNDQHVHLLALQNAQRSILENAFETGNITYNTLVFRKKNFPLHYILYNIIHSLFTYKSLSSVKEFKEQLEIQTADVAKRKQSVFDHEAL